MGRESQRLRAAAGLLVAVFAAVLSVRIWLGERSFELGMSARRRGDFKTADAAYRVASSRGNADAAIDRARLQLLRRDWDGAGSTLRVAMALAPTRGFPHILVAALETDRPGPWDAAREDRVIHACRTAVSLEPGQSTIRRGAADVLLKMVSQRRSSWDDDRVRTVVDDAAADYAVALSREPGSAREIFIGMLAGGADPDALLEVAVSSGAPDALAVLVKVLLERDLWGRVAPGLWIAAETRGVLPALAAAASGQLNRKGLTREALAAARHGLAAEPGYPGLTVLAADVAARLPGAEALTAVPLYRAALVAEPHDQVLRKRFASFLAAKMLYLEAETEVRTVLGARRGDAEAWFLLGEIKRRSGRLSEAADAYRMAVELRPDNAVYRRAAAPLRRQSLDGD